MFTIATTLTTDGIPAPPSDRSRSPTKFHLQSPRSRHVGRSDSASPTESQFSSRSGSASATTRQAATAVVRAAFSHTKQEEVEHKLEQSLDFTPNTVQLRKDFEHRGELESSLNVYDLSFAAPSVQVQVCPAAAVLVIAAATASTTTHRAPPVTQQAKKTTTTIKGKESSNSYEKTVTKPFSPPVQPFQQMSPPRIVNPTTSSSSSLLLLSSDRDRMKVESELKVALERIAAAEQERQAIQIILDTERQKHEEHSKKQQDQISSLEEQLDMEQKSHRAAFDLQESRSQDQLRQSADDHHIRWSSREQLWMSEKAAHNTLIASQLAALETKHASAIAVYDARLKVAFDVHHERVNECSQLRKRVEEQEAQLQESQQRCSTQLQLLTSCRSQLRVLMQTTVELRAEMEVQRQSVADNLASIHISSVAAVHAVRQRAEQMMETRATLDRDRMNSWQSQVQSLTQSLQSAQTESQRQQDQCARLNEELLRSTMELQQSEQRQRVSQQRISSLESRVSDQSAELDKVRDEENSAAENRIRLQQSLTLALDTQHKLQVQLQGRECQVSRQSQQLAGQQRNLDHAKSHLRNLRQQQQHSDAVIRDQLTEHHQLRAECADAKRRYKQAMLSPRVVRTCFHTAPLHTHTHTHTQALAPVSLLTPVSPLTLIDVHTATSPSTNHHYVTGAARYSSH